ncbi:FMN-binding protein [Humibacillus sp. DSM 29435]|uniref:FMN-binding protein n=1 Tax=Humibacillus sp. DSM 29435 TaxID=1869167 RepID=UPI000872E744|nr:FMN-binding protein [Humibacillus sp. DSM 29435]OFE16611.1 FMN-binding protein [Humibacillus sp. DSM 29435]
MRRIVLWAMSTLTVLVLLFSYRTSTSSTVVGAPPAAATAQIATPPTEKPAAAGTATSAQTFTGDAVDTRYGPVQVQVTVAGGKVTAAQALQVPMEDRHDQQINSQAVPVYNGEVVDVQSSQIDVVSGATVTWEGYTQSLQSALDQAHL